MSKPTAHSAAESSIRLSLLDHHTALPLWLSGVVFLGVVLLAMGAAISLLKPAMLVSPNAEITAAVRVYAGYTFSRDLALALMLLIALILRARSALNSLMLLTGMIQLLDVIPDCMEHRYSIIPGILVISVLFCLGAATLTGAPFWKLQAWRTNR
jgi:hypothetical protein